MTDAAYAVLTEDVTTEEYIEGIQALINSGAAWRLEGSVGRSAMDLIEQGYCTLGEEPFTDFYGNRIPSRHEVEPGTKGSASFVEYKAACRED